MRPDSSVSDTMRKKKIAILGATGSIGSQTLDVVRQHPDLFEITLATANRSADTLAAAAAEFSIPDVVLCDPSGVDRLRSALQGTQTKVWTGSESLCSIIAEKDIDIVVAAMVGFSGLAPTLAAIDRGIDIALANKETLVAAGAIVTGMAKSRGTRLLPVDSEHSAIFQCLQAAGDNKVSKIHLTASGGPFRTWDKASIATATAADALKHPNWNMGSKITVDSATMMNKGFEVIEARWLFDISEKDINVVVHPESVIHSMIEFEDGAVLAQMAMPDMRQPIQYALSYPERLPLKSPRLDFSALGKLSFQSPDTDHFPCLALAFEAIQTGGNAPCALNAANEAAVKSFLEGRLSFYGIAQAARAALDGLDFVALPSPDDIFATHREVYRKTLEAIG